MCVLTLVLLKLGTSLSQIDSLKIFDQFIHNSLFIYYKIVLKIVQVPSYFPISFQIIDFTVDIENKFCSDWFPFPHVLGVGKNPADSILCTIITKLVSKVIIIICLEIGAKIIRRCLLEIKKILVLFCLFTCIHLDPILLSLFELHQIEPL